MDKDRTEYLLYESSMVRQERNFKRIWILCIILIVVCVLTNGFWIWREFQYEDIVVEQDVETDDGTAIVNGVGDMYYGTSETDNEGKTP